MFKMLFDWVIAFLPPIKALAAKEAFNTIWVLRRRAIIEAGLSKLQYIRNCPTISMCR
jgi:hypothetical protein